VSAQLTERGWTPRAHRLEGFIRTRARAVVLVAALVAAAASASIGVSFGSDLRYEDEREYVMLASQLADHGRYSLDGVTATGYRPPGYPFALAALHVLGLDIIGMRLANAVLAGAVVGLVFLIGRRLGSEVVGAIAAAIVALHPLLLYTSATLYPQTLGAVLLLALLLVVLRVETSTGSPALILAAMGGLLAGVLLLTVPSFAVMVGLVPLWLLWRRRASALVPIVIFVAIACLPVAAWTVRNMRAFDAFVPVATNSGFNLLLGNSPETTPSSGTEVDISKYDIEARRRMLDEVETDRYFRSEALEWVRENPLDAATLYAGKVANAFTIRTDLATQESSESALQTLVLGIYFLPLLGLVVVRVAFVRRLPLRRGEGLLLWTFVLNVLATAVFFTRIRFRLPLDPLLALTVAVLMTAWLARVVARHELAKR
jgi:4-amino-4-deoxy-L-arabinose transferase-like glycosyltransferase